MRADRCRHGANDRMCHASSHDLPWSPFSVEKDFHNPKSKGVRKLPKTTLEILVRF